MTQGQVVNAYKTLAILTNAQMPFADAYKLCKLRKALTDNWNFQVEQEKALFAKYHATSEGNQIKLENQEEAEALLKELENLTQMSVDNIDGIPIELSMIPANVQLSANDIMTLDGFVTFKE